MYHCSNCNRTWKYDGSYKKNNPCFRCGKLYQRQQAYQGFSASKRRPDFVNTTTTLPEPSLKPAALCAAGLLFGLSAGSTFIAGCSFAGLILTLCFPALTLMCRSSNNSTKEFTKTVSNKNRTVNLCESPIEEALYNAMLAEGLNPELQKQIGIYRVDFVINKLVIECDGHDFHKTKEQRTRDAIQRRYLLAEGYNVINFTGTEIHNNALKCAKEVKNLLCLNQN
jgi:very-short-patch-repair endonuclease